VTIVEQVTQLGRFTNEATNAFSHPPNSTTSHSMLRAFAEVSMASIFILHPNVSLNSLYCRLFLCRGSTRVLDGWRFAATTSEPSMWVIAFHHRLPLQVVRQVQTAVENPSTNCMDSRHVRGGERRRHQRGCVPQHSHVFDSTGTNIVTTYLNCHLLQRRTKLITLFHL
jgi:hypothetical protein